jgi:sialate O-acetylesterase
MVMQRDRPIHVWGFCDPGTEVLVSLAEQEATAVADNDGRFDAFLNPLPAGGPHRMTIAAGETITFEDVLVGEVWVCSGQSNMEWSVNNSKDADLELLTANHPNIRLLSIPKRAAQSPQTDFDGHWQACTAETIKDFSAVGYFFGRRVHQTVDVPVGLIDNAWGGSAAEAWLSKQTLAEAGDYDAMLERWQQQMKNYDYEVLRKEWKSKVAAWKKTGSRGRRPPEPRNRAQGQHRPGNLYNGVLSPVIGYTIRGVIWYQGESNASRAKEYQSLFPLLINTWRDQWQQGDFPFYWVQLADFKAEKTNPGESDWAELREAQTMTMEQLRQTGQAVITDLGDASDIHPRNKLDVANRLARWALANDYGCEIAFRSPQFVSMVRDGKTLRLTFEHVSGGLKARDIREPMGFAIAGTDKKFVRAKAQIQNKDTIEVFSDSVSEPVFVRYAWADNPIANVESSEGLPLTPFRTDP